MDFQGLFEVCYFLQKDEQKMHLHINQMQSRGSVFNAHLDYVKTYGPQAWQDFTQALPDATQHLIRNGFFATRWYPSQTLTEISRTIDTVLGKGDGRLFYEMGRYSCEQTLPDLCRRFYHVNGVHFLIRRIANTWKSQHTAGILRIVEEGEHSISIQLQDFIEEDEKLCISVKGWIYRAAELAGKKKVRHTIIQCKRRGDPICEHKYQWS